MQASNLNPTIPESRLPGRRIVSVLTGLLAGLLSAFSGPLQAEELKDWTSVIRESPYWESKGVYSNIRSVRRWILEGQAYCSDENRHIFFDRRGKFLGYMENADTRAATQQKLNTTRLKFTRDGRSDYWVPGSAGNTGYPFALACKQPHVDLDEAMSRYIGSEAGDLIWGSWDDLSIGSPQSPRSLHQALEEIYKVREQQNRLDLPPEMPRYLAGQLLIESGGRRQAHSAANARGIMQLSTVVLSDCGIAPPNYWHRLAQLDCAMRLTSQNARYLRPAFDKLFGHLPKEKRNRLFTLLVVQAYHGGATRVKDLLDDPELSQPAAYLAQHHQGYSAGDIAFGMIFHNLGRNRLGLASLYYVVDVELAAEALCEDRRMKKAVLCGL
ncbi:lytic transglycosylase domain-containing protein [Marinobacter sp. BGYM27]|uniref:lytic transglycosylase domain-containing protein n=1 Tax=unclassified Marinobacter TaxID=83889 RepID=UPI0021A3995F|nr:lytic transglycosylase domain-containing protein [Marinobacter sp. BGYM27]MDG5500058.1 lytic transglycosylase domain-containing protein [Marinobacter sp. BGYM27]|tara:strand:+ start:7567 stop:8718 length:1152 start_codon:yes stop_codon:yes gene_type:complete